MTGVYNKIEPWILGKGSGNDAYDYLVPLITETGSVIYTQMNREALRSNEDKKFVEAVTQLQGWNYVWEEKKKKINGGVDCSGLQLWGMMQVYGKPITDRTAHGIATSSLTMPGNWEPGSLIFFKYCNANFHHVSTYLGNGKELEPHGNDTNKRENPANIFVRDRLPVSNNPDIVNRRINWHFIFFTDNKGQLVNNF
jgi:hypothetical protein